METRNLFGQTLKELRLESGLTQTQLASEIGVVQGTIYFWENSINEPTASYIVKLAEFFGVSCDTLLGTDPMMSAEREKLEVLRLYNKLDKSQKTLALKLLTLLPNKAPHIVRYGFYTNICRRPPAIEAGFRMWVRTRLLKRK